MRFRGLGSLGGLGLREFGGFGRVFKVWGYLPLFGPPKDCKYGEGTRYIKWCRISIRSRMLG